MMKLQSKKHTDKNKQAKTKLKKTPNNSSQPCTDISLLELCQLR